MLHVRMTKDDNGNLSSGQCHTKGIVEFRYGTIVTRMAFPNTVLGGITPKFWALGAGGEFEIASSSGGDIMTGTRHHDGIQTGQNMSAAALASNIETYGSGSSFNLGEFHIYRMEWEPDKIEIYYIDDNFAFSQDISEEACPGCLELRQSFFLAYSFIATDPVAFVTVPGGGSLTTLVDYVRIYYAKASTVGDFPESTFTGVLDTNGDPVAGSPPAPAPSPSPPAPPPVPDGSPVVRPDPAPAPAPAPVPVPEPAPAPVPEENPVDGPLLPIPDPVSVPIPTREPPAKDVVVVGGGGSDEPEGASGGGGESDGASGGGESDGSAGGGGSNGVGVGGPIIAPGGYRARSASNAQHGPGVCA